MHKINSYRMMIAFMVAIPLLLLTVWSIPRYAQAGYDRGDFVMANKDGGTDSSNNHAPVRAVARASASVRSDVASGGCRAESSAKASARSGEGFESASDHDAQESSDGQCSAQAAADARSEGQRK
jgi:hypothetical protein